MLQKKFYKNSHDIGAGYNLFRKKLYTLWYSRINSCPMYGLIIRLKKMIKNKQH